MPSSLWGNILIFLFLFFILVACTQKPSPPPCQIDPEYIMNVQANAGCFIKDKGRLLVIRQNFSGKLSLPGGTYESGETAQCTAHRETWEETGADVLVGSRLHVFKNNFYLFECSLAEENIELATNDNIEVKEVLWIDPEKTKQNDWRFNQQYSLLLKLFEGS